MSWTTETPTTRTQTPILVVGPESRILDTLERELRALPLPTLVARNIESACRVHIDRTDPPAALLMPESIVRTDAFEEQLALLRIRMGSPRLVPIVFGHKPNEKRRRALREAGIDLALFGRFGRNALRFQVNRALSRWATRKPRGEIRAPKEWRTRMVSQGREKSVRCYSLSSGGGYFVTPRPWIVGSDVSLELPIARGLLRIDGRILYTNLAGSAEGRGLPRGMAISFRPLRDPVQDLIRRDVTATQSSLEV
jgi:hypothetical protein